MKKRLISVLLATAMVFTNSTGVYAAAEEDLIFTGEDPEEELILTEEPSETEEASLEEEILPESPELETDQDSEEDPGEIIIETTESPEEEEAEGENSPASFYPEEDQQHQTPAGYRQLDHDVKIRSLQRDNASGEILLAMEDDLEDYYVTPNLPPLRNQGNYGTCWAFSTLALAEIGMMNNGELPSYYSPEYSKLHLAYFSYRTVEDPLGGTKGDYNSCFESGENILDVGGNVFLSENVLANWTGAAPEENLPYDTE
jgi:C1A family cysteine protease